jgi:hypothetical protein
MNRRDLPLSEWTHDDLEAFLPDADDHQREAVRFLAGTRARLSAEPAPVRRRWAALALLVSRLDRDTSRHGRVRAAAHEFGLRMWGIEHLAPGRDDPAWDPSALASDTLDALLLTPSRAAALAAVRFALPVEQVLDLRHHKMLTEHVDRLLPHLPPGPTRDRLLPWTRVRLLLP